MNSKYIAPLAICAVMTITQSCSDFLDEAPRGNTIASTTDDYEKMLNDPQGFNLQLFEQSYAFWKSDELIFTDGSYATIDNACSYPLSVKATIEYKPTVYSNDETSPEWQSVTKRIYTYNSILNGIDKASGNDADKHALKAEATVMRAYHHFILAQWFAMPYNEQTAATEKAIPIIKDADTQQMHFDLVSNKELYDWIISEIEGACPDLKDRSAHKMRCYLPTGYALLGKVWFAMGKYDKALVACRKAWDMLQDDSNVFLTDLNVKQASYGYKEIPMMRMSSYVPYPYKDNEVLFCRSSSGMRNFYPMYYGMASSEFLKPEIYKLFSDKDLRRNAIVTVDAAGNPLPYPTAVFQGVHTQVGCKLPELILMLAECEARVGDMDAAKSILTNFRKTRLLPGFEGIPSDIDTKEKLIRYCVDEQTREFAGTDYRYYNMRRLWNDPMFSNMHPVTHTVGDKTYQMTESNLRLPFPETVLIWNENWRN